MSDTLQILWQTNRAVAVNKPAQLATIPGRAETDSVLEQVARQLNIPHTGNGDPRIRIVHRLDKDTTGVLLFALDRAAQQHFSHQFQNNLIQKEYLALVRNRPQTDEGVIETQLAPHPTNKKRMAVVKHAGRPARTDWRIEDRFRGFTLIRCFPKTGMTHQIRVHLAHIGLPLAIDPIYGSADPILLSQFKRKYNPVRGEEERPLISRLTLHAHRLRFTNLDGSPIEIEAPMPKDFRSLLHQLQRNARA